MILVLLLQRIQIRTRQGNTHTVGPRSPIGEGSCYPLSVESRPIISSWLKGMITYKKNIAN